MNEGKSMLVADRILQFYKGLTPPEILPNNVETLNPYQQADGWACTTSFYQKYYADTNARRMLFGINPGRFGGGITGVPFTDPVALETCCGIPNNLPKRAELSARFIYDMIAAYGGTKAFYAKFYITGMSPLGFVLAGKNLNYYDLDGWKAIFENQMVDWIHSQLQFSISTDLAYSIGQGQNLKFLRELNQKHGFFGDIVPLPHPRWVMQYRLKRKQDYIDEYLQKLNV